MIWNHISIIFYSAYKANEEQFENIRPIAIIFGVLGALLLLNCFAALSMLLILQIHNISLSDPELATILSMTVTSLIVILNIFLNKNFRRIISFFDAETQDQKRIRLAILFGFVFLLVIMFYSFIATVAN